MDRPLCRCHGEPMLKDGHMRGRQKWQCGVLERQRQRDLYAKPAHAARKRAESVENWRNGGAERRRAQYLDRKSRGVCTKCQQPALSDAYCWDHLNYLEEHHALGF